MIVERFQTQLESIIESLSQETFQDITTNRIEEIILRPLHADAFLEDTGTYDSQDRPKFKITMNQGNEDNERLLTFVHEVVHIDRKIFNRARFASRVPLDIYDAIEETIDQEALRFLTENQDLVKEAFEKLTQIGEKKEG